MTDLDHLFSQVILEAEKPTGPDLWDTTCILTDFLTCPNGTMTQPMPSSTTSKTGPSSTSTSNSWELKDSLRALISIDVNNKLDGESQAFFYPTACQVLPTCVGLKPIVSLLN